MNDINQHLAFPDGRKLKNQSKMAIEPVKNNHRLAEFEDVINSFKSNSAQAKVISWLLKLPDFIFEEQKVVNANNNVENEIQPLSNLRTGLPGLYKESIAANFA